MNLYVVRHAAAEPLGGAGTVPGPAIDADRALTPRGRERFSEAVRSLGRMGIRLARIEHSPWLRAAQTAELLQPLLDGPMAPNPDLADDPSTRLLGGLRHDGTALVGHEPWVSDLVALLCFGDVSGGSGLRFSKGAVAWLEGEPQPSGMRLRAFWPPKTLAALAHG